MWPFKKKVPKEKLVTITLEDTGDKKVNVIKAVRAITGLGLKEAKMLCDGAPNVILERVPLWKAKEFQEYIHDRSEDSLVTLS